MALLLSCLLQLDQSSTTWCDFRGAWVLLLFPGILPFVAFFFFCLKAKPQFSIPSLEVVIHDVLSVIGTSIWMSWPYHFLREDSLRGGRRKKGGKTKGRWAGKEWREAQRQCISPSLLREPDLPVQSTRVPLAAGPWCEWHSHSQQNLWQHALWDLKLATHAF